jgi:hypothetical protein
VLPLRTRRVRPASPAPHSAWPGRAGPYPTQEPAPLPVTADGTASGQQGRHR